ncbi:hypothetical protein BJ742DRAFT_741076 [Cladochytrium replicatum]|nr:hypothetical protein BJ742DRAFT_741076 [Cladochytrium replicatum]
MRTATASAALAAFALLAGSAFAAPATGGAAAPATEKLVKRDYSSYSYGIEDWKTCHPGKDSCAHYGSKCCIARADKHSGKYTCRPAGKDCDDYSYSSDYSSDYYDNSYSTDYYGDSTYYDDSYSYDDSYYYDDSYSGDYYDDPSYSSDYYGARANGAKGRSAPQAKGVHHASKGGRHIPARARQTRPQSSDHEYSYSDHCDVTYKTYVGNCNAAYAQDHKKQPFEECLDGAKAWLEICEAQTKYY